MFLCTREAWISTCCNVDFTWYPFIIFHQMSPPIIVILHLHRFTTENFFNPLKNPETMSLSNYMYMLLLFSRVRTIGGIKTGLNWQGWMNSIDEDITNLIEMSVGDFNHFLSCACIVLECRYRRKDGSEYKLQHCIKFVLEFSNTYVTLKLSIQSFWIIIIKYLTT